MLGLVVTSDPNVALSGSMQGYNVLVLSESESKAMVAYNPNMLAADILLPPYNSVSAAIDGDFEIADRIYSDYLMDQIASKFIGSVSAALLLKKPIMLYVGPDESQSRFLQQLFQFIASYGIVVVEQPCEVQFFIHPFACDRMYVDGYLQTDLYCQLREPFFDYTIAVPKLCAELGIPYGDPNMLDKLNQLKAAVSNSKVPYKGSLGVMV